MAKKSSEQNAEPELRQQLLSLKNKIRQRAESITGGPVVNQNQTLEELNSRRIEVDLKPLKKLPKQNKKNMFI